MSETANMDVVPDSEHRGIVARLPQVPRDLAQLARFDRPIGWWLLFWPCVFGLALSGGLLARWDLALWMLLGAIAMRGAGCVVNDLWDRDLDRKVERTAGRPLASGALRARHALVFLALVLAAALLILLQLNGAAQMLGVASLVPVVLYPLAKRVTDWPQAVLGVIFSWAAPMGYVAVMGGLDGAAFALWAAGFFWILGYDTIYAHQDREDDALVGIRSSALRLGDKTRPFLILCYGLTMGLLALAGWLAGLAPWYLLGLAVPGAMLARQVVALDIAEPALCLRLFKANRDVGLAIAAAFLLGRL